MKIDKSWIDQIWLHITVFILGFTGILGKTITLDGVSLVWWRVGIAFFALLPIIILLRTKKIFLPFKVIAFALFTGFVVGLHWITFFHAIKISNVSVTLAALSSTTLMVSLLEPIFQKKKISPIQVLLGILIMIGLSIILIDEHNFQLGLFVGLLSAILAALFTILNKKISFYNADALVLCTWEMLGAFISISIILLFSDILPKTLPTNIDLFWLLILGVICTALTFSISIWLLERLTAYQVTLAINMEPIYGILLAALIFHENNELKLSFYLGSLFIIGAVIFYSVYNRKKQVQFKRY
jgi:drug/metabolite transporter (DMT)-like permease